MSNRKLILSFGAAAMFLSACDTDKLTRANENPNDPTNAPSAALFTNSARLAAARWIDGVGGTRYGFLPQHLAQAQYPDDDQYLSARLGAAATAGLFNGSYNAELQDLALIIDRGQTASDAGLWGPAQVLSSWEFGVLTDVYGDVPYSQAFDPAVLTPVYDPQATIYTGIFADLNAASDALATASNSLGSGDPIYGGDPASWRKFANSLRLRHALRLANVAGEAARINTEISAAIADGGVAGMIDENAENARLVWPGDGIYDSPWANNFKTRDDHRISTRLLTIMEELNDPRITVYAMPAEVVVPEVVVGGVQRTQNWCPAFAGGACYVGLQNALTQATASPLLANTSRPGSIFYPGVTSYGTFGGLGTKFPSYFMTAAETYFNLAEASQRGFGGLTAATAATYYNLGITRSMEMWGMTSAQITAYLATPGVVYTPGNAGLIQIATQKWLALYTDPIQAWAEVRRTCQPARVEPGPNARTNFNIIPRRFQYSNTEQAVNGTNRTAAITTLNPATDDLRSRFYWDNATGWAASPTYVAGCTDKTS
jgi:hypothetical protein